MTHRISCLFVALAAGGLAAGCATSTAPAAPRPSSGAVALTPNVATVLDISATSAWDSEERLLPQQPILALVNAGDSIDSPSAFSMSCGLDNGAFTARLGKQPTDRVGQSAAFRMKLGAESKTLAGKFAANPKTGDADFVFSVEPVTLRTMAQLDEVDFITDKGEPQWAFVAGGSAAKPKAKYVGSLKNLNAASQAFLIYCNPK
ncbi:MAG: hypothetical protein GC155_16095 [Alphaproteobacteria bacterium]|nr:hypothetical protein [Alphaproteobacteria bacterium]